eukprot:Awhi_evm1s10346
MLQEEIEKRDLHIRDLQKEKQNQEADYKNLVATLRKKVGRQDAKINNLTKNNGNGGSNSASSGSSGSSGRRQSKTSFTNSNSVHSVNSNGSENGCHRDDITSFHTTGSQSSLVSFNSSCEVVDENNNVLLIYDSSNQNINGADDDLEFRGNSVEDKKNSKNKNKNRKETENFNHLLKDIDATVRDIQTILQPSIADGDKNNDAESRSIGQKKTRERKTSISKAFKKMWPSIRENSGNSSNSSGNSYNSNIISDYNDSDYDSGTDGEPQRAPPPPPISAAGSSSSHRAVRREMSLPMESTGNSKSFSSFFTDDSLIFMNDVKEDPHLHQQTTYSKSNVDLCEKIDETGRPRRSSVHVVTSSKSDDDYNAYTLYGNDNDNFGDFNRDNNEWNSDGRSSFNSKGRKFSLDSGVDRENGVNAFFHSRAAASFRDKIVEENLQPSHNNRSNSKAIAKTANLVTPDAGNNRNNKSSGRRFSRESINKNRSGSMTSPTIVPIIPEQPMNKPLEPFPNRSMSSPVNDFRTLHQTESSPASSIVLGELNGGHGGNGGGKVLGPKIVSASDDLLNTSSRHTTRNFSPPKNEYKFNFSQILSRWKQQEIRTEIQENDSSMRPRSKTESISSTTSTTSARARTDSQSSITIPSTRVRSPSTSSVKSPSSLRFRFWKNDKSCSEPTSAIDSTDSMFIETGNNDNDGNSDSNSNNMSSNNSTINTSAVSMLGEDCPPKEKRRSRRLSFVEFFAGKNDSEDENSTTNAKNESFGMDNDNFLENDSGKEKEKVTQNLNGNSLLTTSESLNSANVTNHSETNNQSPSSSSTTTTTSENLNETQINHKFVIPTIHLESVDCF